MARYSISGNKIQTLRDRQALFTKEADPNLFKKDFNLSFRGGGRLLADKFILKKKPKNYMDLK